MQNIHNLQRNETQNNQKKNSLQGYKRNQDTETGSKKTQKTPADTKMTTRRQNDCKRINIVRRCHKKT